MGNYLSTSNSNKESIQVINEPDHVRVVMSTSEEHQETQETQETQENENTTYMNGTFDDHIIYKKNLKKNNKKNKKNNKKNNKKKH